VLSAWGVALAVLGPILALQSMLFFFAFIALASGALLAICFAKGEPPMWRWGKR
jgi:hypothetical protein